MHRRITNWSQITRLPLQNPNEHITAPEDAMPSELVPQLHPSGGYENIVTALGVLSRYYLPTQNLIKTPKKLLKI